METIKIFIETSWWAPQIVFFIVAGVVMLSACYFVYKITNAIIDWRREKLPNKIKFAVLDDGEHNVVYIRKDVIAAPEVLSQALTLQIEDKNTDED